jgi:hypothetical protein
MIAVLGLNCSVAFKRLVVFVLFGESKLLRSPRSNRLPVLPIYIVYPRDYRSRDKVLKDTGRVV